MDLRIQKTKKAIRDTFLQMLQETEISKITVRSLTDRAMINRKTFYLHYETMDDLVRELLDEITEDYIQAYEKLPEGRPHSEANAVFFRYFAAQPDYVQKILCYPPYDSLCRRIFDRAYNHQVQKNPTMMNLPVPVQNLIRTFYRASTLDLYRQWMLDGRVLSLEEIVDLSNEMICYGDQGVQKIISR